MLEDAQNKYIKRKETKKIRTTSSSLPKQDGLTFIDITVAMFYDVGSDLKFGPKHGIIGAM